MTQGEMWYRKRQATRSQNYVCRGWEGILGDLDQNMILKQKHKSSKEFGHEYNKGGVT